ncbi:MAG: aminotransferase class IV [Bacteroidota bacterium]
MKAYFNGSWIENKITLPLNDRALQFGDGAFETMIYQKGKVNYLHDHLERLNDALEILHMNPLHLSEAEVNDLVKELIKKNKIEDPARIKLMVWRKGQKQKAYATSERNRNYLVLANRCNPVDLNILSKVGYSDAIRNYESVRSRFKSLSSLHYITAAFERDDKDLEELILLDRKGNLSECIAANLFWIKDGKVFTPALSTGCINGIMRRQLVKWCKTQQIEFVETITHPKILRAAEHVFCTNIAGISIFEHVASNTYAISGVLMDLIVRMVLDPDRN